MKPLSILPVLALLVSSCAQQHLTVADKAYDRMAYARASAHYDKALARLNDRGAMVRAADAHDHTGDLAKAASWYAKADQLQPLSGSDALNYGRLLQRLGRTSDAATQFERVLADRPEDAVVRELSLAIATRDAFFVDTTLFTIRPVIIPGTTSVFSAIPYQGGLLVTAENADNGPENPWNGSSFLDLYTTKPASSGNWTTAMPLEGEVNGRFHDGPAVLSANGRELYFTRSDYYKFRLNKDQQAVSHLMLFKAELQQDGRWGNIMSFAYNGIDFSAGHAALSADGNMLLYVSDMPGGFGGTDIYRCDRQADGSWGYPRNLGPTVNTAANEMFPTLQGDTLHFSSNGHRTLGGLDILRAVRNGDEWSTPENLNYPINSARDDFAFVPTADGRSGYLSSDRSGRDQVYTFVANAPTLVLEGAFTSEADQAPMAGVRVELLDETTGIRTELTTGPDGLYRFPLEPGHRYRVLGGKDGMFTESRDISTVGQRISRTYTEDFQLMPVVVDKPIVIENIYYDYDRWEIRPDAALELDKVARLFMDNPGLRFELSSHTDSRASDTYNLVLSDARANSAVDYLIRKGVDPGRISARGYGEQKLVNHCADDVPCSEEEHQANRRTEFKVIGTAALP